MGNTANRLQQQYYQRDTLSTNRTNTTRSATSTDTNRNKQATSGLYLLYLIHRTWAIVVSERKVSRFAHRSRHRTNSITSTISDGDTTSSSDSSVNSKYSYCSCGYCKNDDFSDYTSDLQSDLPSRMPPNSEEGRRLTGTNTIQKKKDNQQWLSEEDYSKEQQRPPIYNPEDYAAALRKWSKRSCVTANNGQTNLGLYQNPDGTANETTRTNSAPPATSSSSSSSNKFNDLNGGNNSTGANMNIALGDATLLRDYRNPMLTTSAGGEMSLRQFSSVSELLTKLRADLRFAFPSFVQEFVGEPLDGVTLLLELLRGVQLSQTGGTVQRVPPAIQRRALLDELVCLQCLICCCVRYEEAIRRLASSPAGLYTLAVCIMSNVSRSRIIALKLLTMACEPPGNGHAPVSESLSTLRLRFGEPVRFRFLIGVLSSAGNHPELLVAGLRFLNAFMMSAGNPQKRLYVQAELEQAGFDINLFRKIVPTNTPFTEQVYKEIENWERNHVNIEKLTCHAEEIERQNNSLKEKMKLLERRVQILQEEKGILLSLEQCLKDRCSELQEEMTNTRPTKPNKLTDRRRSSNKREDSTTPAEDEGISSSERSLSPDDDIQREPMVYEVINVQNDTILVNTKNHSKNKLNKSNNHRNRKNSHNEEETTIEEVIEELKNIINDAETEDKNKKPSTNIVQDTKNNCIQIKIDQPTENLEAEIVPSNLHPQPPRKSKSLIHLFFPHNDSIQYECRQQEIFFDEEDTPLYTSDEDSDSLLSASKCQNTTRTCDKQDIADDNRALLDSIMDAKDRAEEYERHRQKARSFHLTPSDRKIKDANIKSVKHNSSDGLFIVDVNSPAETPVLKHHKHNTQKVSKTSPDELAASDKFRSKSLDRIDEGLDAMVDIVLTSDTNKQNSIKCHRKRQAANSTTTTKTPLVIHISKTRNNSFRTECSQGNDRITQFPANPNIAFPTAAAYYDDKHRVFLPTNATRTMDVDNEPVSIQSHRLILPNDTSNNSTSTFSIKRGNAGLYSGSHNGKKLISSIPSSDYRSMSPMVGVITGGRTTSHGSGSKVTDLPSGLY